MNSNIKQFLIISFIFIIIWWFQSIDDKKNKKERITFYDTYKLPILVSAIVGLILNITFFVDINKKECNNIDEFIIITPTKPSNNIISDQQIFTDMPDF